MLEKEEGTEDRQFVKASMDKIRRGENRKRLSTVFVVGVCCSFLLVVHCLLFGVAA
jgi:hypothetical protein